MSSAVTDSSSSLIMRFVAKNVHSLADIVTAGVDCEVYTCIFVVYIHLFSKYSAGIQG